ncbi:MAG: hypothetical protein ACO1RT_16230, partial [Planctomycetaceae bacterium]
AGDVFKVLGVGAETNRAPISGGLEHILAATVAEAASDEGNPRRAPPMTQLTDGVDQDDGMSVPLGGRL